MRIWLLCIFTSHWCKFHVFPYAFLGLAGMPRRIPDYADSFYVYNAIASCFYGYLIGLFVFYWLSLKKMPEKLFR